MTKRKDYFSVIVFGGAWFLFCLLLSLGFGWLVSTTTSNIILRVVVTIICFVLGIYKGREFFKIRMITVKKDDPKTDWRGYLNDIQLLMLAVIFVNSINTFNNGFDWLSFGEFICGLLFVGVLLHMKHTRFVK